jgi:plastocyanin
MSKNVWTVLIVLIVVLAGGWLFVSSRNQTNPTTSNETTTPTAETPIQTPAGSESTDSASTTEQNMVMISSSGFSPESLTVKVGDTVTWKNDDTKPHTVNSDPHPAHTLFPELNEISAIRAGETKTHTFTKAGTFKYHDHLNPASTGTIVVE